MASLADNSFSSTLLGITTAKLEQLAKKRNTFENHYAEVNARLENEKDELKKVKILSDGLKVCFAIPLSPNGQFVRGSTNNPCMEIDLKNFDRFLGQAHYDPSISEKAVKQWQEALARHLEVQSLKFLYADLYGRLTTEWLSSKQRAVPDAPKQDVDTDDFEHVSSARRMHSRAKWEQSVFEPADVSQESILVMLRAIFEKPDDNGKQVGEALAELRKNVENLETCLARPTNFSEGTLKWTITGLVSSDLLTEEKRTVLKGFLENSVVLGEIADVLNMRMASLDEWSWGEAVHLEERRQLNGNFNIFMHEDLLQAIFLQYIGVKWSVGWKESFLSFYKSKDVWKSPQAVMSSKDRKRREYFLGGQRSTSSMAFKERRLYRLHFFVYQLHDYEEQPFSTDQGAEEANFEEIYQQPQQPPSGRTKQTARRSARMAAPPVQLQGNVRRFMATPSNDVAFADDDAIEAEYADEDDIEDEKNQMEAKQMLLHLFSTRILIDTRLHGEITCFRSQINSLYSSLPHVTILTVLQYLGVSKKWVAFFRRFLEAPLQFVDQSSAPQKRKRGTPGSHVLSEVFSEVVLFCLDFLVNSVTENNLWRMGDDFWFWSRKHESCTTAWRSVNKFMETVGLSLNESRSGSAHMARKVDGANDLLSLGVGSDLPHGQIRWGMLYLNPESGLFEIDQRMVDKHIDEMSQQLEGKKDSVFAWVQGWNAYATTFFTTNFGKPANCFGRQHVDKMLATHERIQRKIFTSSATNVDTGGEGGSVVEYLAQSIERRFGAKDLPDGYFFFPSVLGGLEIGSPFIGLLQMLEAIEEDPSKLIDDFLQSERDSYRAAKADFESGETQETNYEMVEFRRKNSLDQFFSFEEYTRFREVQDDRLGQVFDSLVLTPRGCQNVEGPQGDGAMNAALNALGGQPNLRGVKANWYEMDS